MTHLIRRAVALSALGLLAGLPAFAEAYPVFKVETPAFDAQRAQGLFAGAFGETKPESRKLPFRDGAMALAEGKRVLEFEARSGYWYGADKALMWNSQVQGEAPSAGQAIEQAQAFLRKTEFLPEDKLLNYRQASVAETAVGADIPGRVDKRVLDYTVTYAASVRTPNGEVPVTGGGSEVSVTIGVNGQVSGFSGGWRPIADEVAMVEVGTPQDAVEAFMKAHPEMKAVELKAELAYYAAPAFEAQEFLAPVWIISGQVEINGERTPLRPAMLAASEYGPKLEVGQPIRPRDLNLKPSDGLKPDEEGGGRPTLQLDPSQIERLKKTPLQPVKPLVDPSQLPRPKLEKPLKTGWLDWVFPPAFAQSPGDYGGKECATSWIGESQGLGGSSGNRQGFVDKCRQAGWAVNFDWGDQNAFESDWNANDDAWVDAADLIFYTGHAGPNGWNLYTPSDGSLSTGEPGGALDRWGANDAEWIIIAACGPLQSNHFVGSVGNAFDRWRDVFDGLHIFLGYGAVTFDNTSEGRRFMELALSGENMISAWFRTAREIQPSTNDESAPNGPTIYVVAMYAHNGDHCTENDHAHGTGSVCSDVTGSAQRRTMMWSGT